jgi:uncharacterized protein (UPF0264 family)
MRLLVSVATADDARAAVEGGADLVDAKDPEKGALGAVTPARFAEIAGAVRGARPLTAALGDLHDAADTTALTTLAVQAAGAGATLVKIGLHGTCDAGAATRLATAVVRGLGTSPCGVVLVAYADAPPESSLLLDALIDVAATCGARGVLLDTMDKSGGSLFDVLTDRQVNTWVAAAHARGLIAALAGKLTTDGVSRAANAGADIAGVRGAVCVGGRAGRVSSDLVRSLRERGAVS